jgi:hypothetical protein
LEQLLLVLYSFSQERHALQHTLNAALMASGAEGYAAQRAHDLPDATQIGSSGHQRFVAPSEDQRWKVGAVTACGGMGDRDVIGSEFKSHAVTLHV